MSKILFFDIDGTLVGFDGKMSESTKLALREARKNGHKIFLCTGRSYNQIYDFLLDFGFDGIVAAAGGYVEYQGKTIFHDVFGEKLVQNVLDKIEKEGTEEFLPYLEAWKMLEVKKVAARIAEVENKISKRI